MKQQKLSLFFTQKRIAVEPENQEDGLDKDGEAGEVSSMLKCHYDENRIFSIEAILKHKQVAWIRRKMLFTVFKYLFLFQRYSSF